MSPALPDKEKVTPPVVAEGCSDYPLAWVLAIATDLEDRIRVLSGERRAAYRRVKVIRDGGHLIPGSLNEEIADNEAALQQTLTRYRQLSGTAGSRERAARLDKTRRLPGQ